ncbi:MAG: hypothetical protein JWN68_1163 [Nocardioides sp.]|uniref:hypothetical protein n=1 Tax=Nocardioides sp. TaxID=35761 RepID=UPI0026343712|nr:hypothetical protein [Nocardioides sp.]MCW2833210.1 hypothetical protein [Nocardioides sp.]
MGLVALLTLTVRMPFAIDPLSSDEGGLLLVASQWRPGTSLYGNYWVDRPPLLLDFFSLANTLGGTIALRMLGACLVAFSVVLAGRIGATAVPRTHVLRWTPVLTAGTAAVFLVNPLFGALEVDGELVAVALVLLSAERMLRASSAGGAISTRWLYFTAGAAAAAAVLVKQNEVDALVLMAVLSVGTVRHRGGASAARAVATFFAGAVTCVGVVLAHALTRGTTLPGLWEAVVTFRLDASAVISSSASSATSARLRSVLVCLVVSGAPAIVVLLARRLRARVAPPAVNLRPAAIALLAWESVSMLAGGSYWLHYLLVLVPGLVFAVAVICAGSGNADEVPAARSSRTVPASLLAVLTYAAVASLAAISVVGFRTDSTSGGDAIGAWLATHKQPGDTAVVAYGHANILQDSGLSSPYPELWSLPIKVRDPQLLDLTRVLAGRSRPDWVVTTGASLDAWGIDSSSATVELRDHYRDVAIVGDSHIYHRLPQPSVAAHHQHKRSHRGSVVVVRSLSGWRPDPEPHDQHTPDHGPKDAEQGPGSNGVLLGDQDPVYDGR